MTERIEGMTEHVRSAAAGSGRLGEAVAAAGSGVDRYTIADHPDLDVLNHELNNLYGNGFE